MPAFARTPEDVERVMNRASELVDKADAAMQTDEVSQAVYTLTRWLLGVEDLDPVADLLEDGLDLDDE